MQAVNLEKITGELAVITGCLDLEEDFALKAEDGSFLNFFPVKYPGGHVRKSFGIEFREDGWYLHTSSSILNGKVDNIYKAQLCLQLVKGSMTWESALRLIAQICRGNIKDTIRTMEILKNAGVIESNRD